jgi:hypothetical protein
LPSQKLATESLEIAAPSPLAATEQCEAIKSIAARQACIDRQPSENAGKRDSGVSYNPKMMDAVKKLKQKDDRLTAKLRGVCRGY